MLRPILITIAALCAAACQSGVQIEDETRNMAVESRSDYARKFNIVLRDEQTGKTFLVRPGVGKRRRCYDGPTKSRPGQVIPIRVNRYRQDDGKIEYSVDRMALRAQIC